MDMAKIILNGKQKDIADGSKLSALLSEIELPKYFVVEKNMQIVYKEQYETEILNDGDTVEIAVFCGGG